MLLISVYIREYAWPAISSGVLNTPPTLLLILLSMLSLHLQQGENARQQRCEPVQLQSQSRCKATN